MTLKSLPFQGRSVLTSAREPKARPTSTRTRPGTGTGLVRCAHPPKLCTSEAGVITCRCGAQSFPDYQALGGIALDIGERLPEQPAGRTSTATGPLTLGGGKASRNDQRQSAL